MRVKKKGRAYLQKTASNKKKKSVSN